jgi:hypothetical protein
MTDEEEFAARSQLKWTREGDACCSIADAEWGAWSPTQTTPACGDQSKSTASKRGQLSSAPATRLRRQSSDSC